MTTFLALVMGSYFFLLLLLMVGWRRNFGRQPEPREHNIFISVLIPFRNEEDKLQSLVASLRQIEYADDLYEVIFINDNSTDNSCRLLEELIADRANYCLIDSIGEGKKQALTTGVQKAVGKIILTTDADCQVPKKWLVKVSSCFFDDSVHLAFGGVNLRSLGTFFSRVQEVEWLSLIGTAASTLGLGFFSMCNGANMAYRKDAFIAVGGYDDNYQIPSGDDEFLARKIYSKFPGSIRFLSSSDAVVSTGPAKTLKEFFNQRIRWAGKWRHNHSLGVKLFAAWIPVIHLAFLALVNGAITGYLSIAVVLTAAILKVLLEVSFLRPVSRFLGGRWDWVMVILWQFIYPIYVLVVGFASLFVRYEWKGRRLHNKM